MNIQQADSFRILIRHMEGVCTRTLNMAEFTSSCGTPACAIGEACSIPALRARGLSVSATLVGGLGFPPVYLGEYDDRGARFFGIDRASDGEALFGSFASNAWKRNAVSPQEWAVEARKVLAAHGYGMNDAPAKPDAFVAFMARVQEPVAVTA